MNGDVPSAAGERGVLLVNLGSPSAPTPEAVRAFLDEFLADPLVVDLPPLVWSVIRRGLVLPRRSARVARLYASIWTEHGSPLVHWSRRQRELLAAELGPGFRVALAMRYGQPSIAAGLAELADCRDVRVVPLFPQFSGPTTGSFLAAVERERARVRFAPRLESVRSFAEHPHYVEAVAAPLREAIASEAPEYVVLCFHGLPERFIARGDPYRDECHATARAVADASGLGADRWSLVWQSRFGAGKWLEPAADRFVPALAARKKHVLLAAPGFVSDCLETEEELGVRLRASFLAAGGERFRLLPCLNDRPDWIRALAALTRGEHGERGGPAPLAPATRH